MISKLNRTRLRTIRVFSKMQISYQYASLCIFLAWTCALRAYAFHPRYTLIPQDARKVRLTSWVRSSSTIVMQKSSSSYSKPRINKISLEYDFCKVPYETGIKHIHSPEHISQTHKFGAPFFKLVKVLPPKLSASKASITCFCSTLLLKNMYIRMYTYRADQSNLLFFNAQGKALYQVCLTVLPTEGFSSHRLNIEISLFSRLIPSYVIEAVMPIFLFINGLEDQLAFTHKHETPDQELESNLSRYRKIVNKHLGFELFEFASGK